MYRNTQNFFKFIFCTIVKMHFCEKQMSQPDWDLLKVLAKTLRLYLVLIHRERERVVVVVDHSLVGHDKKKGNSIFEWNVTVHGWAWLDTSKCLWGTVLPLMRHMNWGRNVRWIRTPAELIYWRLGVGVIMVWLRRKFQKCGLCLVSYIM